MDQQPTVAPEQPMQNVPQPAMAPAPSGDPGKGLGIAGLIGAFLFPLIGLILSIIGRSKSKKAGYSNGLALAGIIISVINMLIASVAVVVLVLGGAALVEKCEELGPGTHYENGVKYECDM